jgi:enoyl-CoA hydratase/carnithine racemase
MEYTIERRAKGYLLFTIKRSEKRNAINFEVMKGFKEAIEQAAAPDIKALVITGEGDQAFCSGGDLSVFHLLETKEEAYTMLSKMADILYALLTLSKPTIAVINGHSVGGGCEIAAACDFRIARKGIKAGFVQGKQSITTGWGGGAILAEKLSAGKAMKLLMEADTHSAEDLKDLGFIDSLYESQPLDACELFLNKLLAIDINVVQSYKHVWIRKWQETNLRERIEKEVQNCAVLWESEAHHEHVKKFITKKLTNKE